MAALLGCRTRSSSCQISDGDVFEVNVNRLPCTTYAVEHSINMIRASLLALVILGSSFSMNVLVWSPSIGHSHVRFMGNIADILVKDGYNVTVFTPIMDPHVHVIGHQSATKQLLFQSKYYDPNEWLTLDFKGGFWEAPKVEGRCMNMDDMDKFRELNYKICKGLLDDATILSTLRDCHFDIALHEMYDYCVVAILEMIGIKNTIVVSALGVTPHVQTIAGFPSNPSFVPGMLTTYSDEMSFWERLDNFKLGIETRSSDADAERDIWNLVNEYRPGFPDLSSLVKQKTGVVLLNSNEVTETPRPTANILRYIGGATLHEPKKLPVELDALLDERPKTVLFSLGSLAQSKDMPLRLKQEIIAAFASFPNTTFVWKYEEENDALLFEKYPNIHTMKWVPQTDLLADQRLSLFITHAGMNSVLEAVFSGKPMVAIPLFVDQILNAKNMQSRGLGVMVDKHDLNRDTLIAALRATLFANSTYARKAASVAKYLHGRPAAARAEISHWVKLVAEEGLLDHLVMRSREMSFLTYYCIDIIAYLGVQYIIIFFLLYKALKFVYIQICRFIIKFKAE
ncbi:unnamed protein product [Cylicocyclus nassatus]|uniref:glucuronosyltransferase n=1 Tax=Cylicocyclus nassatus TaxID=53992 RepID=A0AA36HBX1_CYLNA|nr:unnamed protein product [Cylicocyclus nassatus]